MTPNSQLPEKILSHESGHVLDVHSIFYTIQGEGPFTGRPAVFIRLAGCNIACPGCDTEYTQGRKLFSVDEVVIAAWKAVPKSALARGRSKPIVVITGGEPFRQNIVHLTRTLMNEGFRIQIETNGMLPIYPQFGFIVVSPKNHKVHPSTAQADAFKYVIDADAVDPEDGLPLEALGRKIPARLARPPLGFTGPIYVNPMDSQDPEKNKRNLEAAVASSLKFGYVLGLQVHKIINLP